MLTRIERKVALLRAGVTMSDIARQLGVTVQHISHVVSGKSRSPRVEQAIADAIGKKPSQVFPPANSAAA